MTATVQESPLAPAAFDTIANSYDTRFTFSAIGIAQRAQIWRKALSVFSEGDRVLELNCGTGHDALFLASRGISVIASDGSPRMIEQAKQRLAAADPRLPVSFHVLPIERLHEIPQKPFFDGVFSNFSGLNCVADLSASAQQLSERVLPGAQLLLCFSTRCCLWEILRHSLRLDFATALRRFRGFAVATVGGHSFPIYYPTVRTIRKCFGPKFRLQSITGVGVTVPPSYLESWAKEHPTLLRSLVATDLILGRIPGLRVVGDHMLLHLERV